MTDKPPFGIDASPPKDKPPFGIDTGMLKAKPKDAAPKKLAAIDDAAERQGFVTREGQGRRGRPASPRTGQVHAKVLPEVSEDIAREAQLRGVTQGVLIEEAWSLYRAEKG
jgi:hypothetical protein